MSKTSKAPSLGGRQGIRKVAKLTDHKRLQPKKQWDGKEENKPGLDEGLILC